jgi:hypothetical protein
VAVIAQARVVEVVARVVTSTENGPDREIASVGVTDTALARGAAVGAVVEAVVAVAMKNVGRIAITILLITRRIHHDALITCSRRLLH